MCRIAAALSLSLALLAACAPTVRPASARVGVDTFYTSTVNGEGASFDSTRGAWVYRTPAYTLRYRLGTLPEGVAPASIKLELRNTGRAPLEIAWGETTFTYPSGTTSGVIHRGVPYGERPTELPPTRVPPGALLEDRAVPVAGIVISEGELSVRPFFTSAQLGEGSFKLLLPLQTQGGLEVLDIGFEGCDGSESLGVTTDKSR